MLIRIASPNEYPQHTFLWGNKQTYPLLITKYPPYQFIWGYARKRIYKSCSLQIEKFFTRDNCTTSINEPHDAKQLPSILIFQFATQILKYLSVDHTDVLVLTLPPQKKTQQLFFAIRPFNADGAEQQTVVHTIRMPRAKNIFYHITHLSLNVFVTTNWTLINILDHKSTYSASNTVLLIEKYYEFFLRKHTHLTL